MACPKGWFIIYKDDWVRRKTKGALRNFLTMATGFVFFFLERGDRVAKKY